MPNPILETIPLGFPFPTLDPFLFLAYHKDQYPASDGHFGVPKTLMQGRQLGSDFESREGFRMYHGAPVPGFPSHPHRGFETVTLARKGLVDHADSLGGAARYGNGDVQWMTAGDGIQHSEMFPLLDSQKPNLLDLFQIWLNLPAKNKRVPPEAKMFWAGEYPRIEETDPAGKQIHIELIAGNYKDYQAALPPKNSWAFAEENHVRILVIELDPEAKWTLPASIPGLNKMLYFTEGSALSSSQNTLSLNQAWHLKSDHSLALKNGEKKATLLLLEGAPINEPVAQHGPFVMNTIEEVREAFDDYRRTQFGGWPWKSNTPVHGSKEERFWKTPKGTLETPQNK